MLVLTVALAGCDLAEDDFQPQVVVEGTIEAGQPMRGVRLRLSKTAPIEQTYRFEDRFLSGARVKLVLLSEDGRPDSTFLFTENLEGEGKNGLGNYLYRTGDATIRVLPNRRYRFVATFPVGTEGAALVPPSDSVWAETTVPDDFEITCRDPSLVCLDPDEEEPGFSLAEIPYDIEQPSPAIDVTIEETPGRQAVFIFNIRALEPERYPLTPLAASFVENGDLDPDDLVSGSSPILNEANYERNPDGTLRLRVPWFAISYFGPTVFTANALDDALYDFLRSRDAQFNPTTLSPGEIQRVFSNVENGVGVFGSIARVAADTVLIEPLAP